ncbi:MAG: hypothetical protein WD766_02095 [Gemmatimonadota bacterium]
MRTRSVTVIALLAGLVPVETSGQDVRLDLGAGLVTNDRDEVRTGLTLAPAILWGGPSAALLARAEAVLPVEGGSQAYVTLAGKALSASRGVGISIRAEASGRVTSEGWGGSGGVVTPGAIYAGKSWAIEAGPRLGFTRHPRSDELVGRSGWPLLGTSGQSRSATTALRGIVAEARAVSGPVQWLGGWSAMHAGDGVRWDDIVGGLTVDAGRVSLGFAGGQRSGAASERWAQARTTVFLSPAVQLLVRGGRYPADPLTGRPGGMTAGVALTVRSEPRSEGRAADHP